MTVVLIVVFSILGLAAVLGIIKLITAKETSWKAVVLDVLTTLSAAVLLLLAFVLDSDFLMDIALVYAVLSFAAVLVVARYMERGL
jgi:multicomponent Na+:H+ antiporter subunit F